MEWLPPKIENKRRKSAFTTAVQYGAECSNQSNKARERNYEAYRLERKM